MGPVDRVQYSFLGVKWMTIIQSPLFYLANAGYVITISCGAYRGLLVIGCEHPV